MNTLKSNYKSTISSIIAYSFSLIFFALAIIGFFNHLDKSFGIPNIIIIILMFFASAVLFFIARGINKNKLWARITFGILIIPLLSFSIQKIFEGRFEMIFVSLAVIFLEIELYQNKDPLLILKKIFKLN